MYTLIFMAGSSPISIAFGKAVKQQRLTKGLTQDELAHHCGVDRTYISRIERGLKNPTLSVIWDIATHLKISLVALTTLTMQKMPVDHTVLPENQATSDLVDD
ncbi:MULTISPECIES: helix-turn-helix transcriptional regulator [unclassified Spirosoma]|jgi:transcriptional regulator with XRE-family HTH domain|uniref:helix-turn-helix domain-containing protein n=1 Tax=unclassified Spirosoma TaxID=2621999 RepID=UPI0025E35A93|nr:MULTISPECIES: helix-turn-helix transcriptional regulator [unclassified Spirosoma]